MTPDVRASAPLTFTFGRSWRQRFPRCCRSLCVRMADKSEKVPHHTIRGARVGRIRKDCTFPQ
jgi:hypothetical protein